MKTIMYKVSAGVLTFLLLAFTSCEKNSAEANNALYSPFLMASADGISIILQDRLIMALGDATPDLTMEEIKLLASMRNEEKVARDVYAFFAEKWGHPVFKRISSAENTHMTAVNSLMKYYELADTVISEPGVFTDNKAQDLYDELISKGSGSLADAFMTGALIEEMDIKDLRAAMSLTSDENIKMVFSNLERGSRNHLRAFNRQLIIRKLVYMPVHITRDEYNAIVNSSVEAGNAYRMNPGRPCIRNN